MHRAAKFAVVLVVVVSGTGLSVAQEGVTPPTVQITPPTITFASEPVLVEAAPGVRVVPDYDEEVFVVNNVYWVRRDEHWFRSTTWNGRWVYVEPRHVPGVIVGVPLGHYRHWKPGPHPQHWRGKVVVGPGPHHGGAVVVRRGHGPGRVKVRIR